MLPLTPDDHALIAQARDAIRRNYDSVHENHTVGAAVRCADGSIFCGINVYAIHGACAEQFALGTAITAGQRDFTTIVAVRGENGEEIIPPCGNCRQILSDYAPDCGVILDCDGTLAKMPARDLLPFAYHSEDA